MDCMSIPNLGSVALMVFEKHCLDMTDRQTDEQTDMAKSIFLVALIKNIYKGDFNKSATKVFLHKRKTILDINKIV